LTAIVTRGDAAHLHLPDETVDLVVTSPPYHSLRSYQDGGEHMPGQIGDEETPGQYLDALIDCTREWVRCLKSTGSLFVNLGDAYSNKGLRGLPWRYALRCVDDLGLILRAEIVWAKPNGLPESVTDRVRRSHEQVFHFVKQSRYYTAVDEIREEVLFPGKTRSSDKARESVRHLGAQKQTGLGTGGENPLGKLPGSVWTIPTAPLVAPEHLGVDHFAAYPPELVRRIVLGWSPREVCTVCGEGRRPVVEKGEYRVVAGAHRAAATTASYGTGQRHGTGASSLGRERDTTVIGYACGCPDTAAPATRGIVMDPFGGTGTTALVASAFGRVGISVDLSADYCRLAQWRTTDRGELARVLGVPKPEPVAESQLGLFEGLA
jgi:DNA modification methylase